MNTIPEHIKAPLHRLIDGGLLVDEIAFMMQLSEEAVKREIERIVATSTKTRARRRPLTSTAKGSRSAIGARVHPPSLASCARANSSDPMWEADTRRDLTKRKSVPLKVRF